MMRFVVGYDRSQISLFPERLDDYLDEEECRAFTLRETSGGGSTAARLDAAHVVTFVPVIKGSQTDAEGGSSSRLFVVRPDGAGALGEIRTPDPRIRSPMLYPAELRARAWARLPDLAGQGQHPASRPVAVMSHHQTPPGSSMPASVKSRRNFRTRRMLVFCSS